MFMIVRVIIPLIGKIVVFRGDTNRAFPFCLAYYVAGGFPCTNLANAVNYCGRPFTIHGRTLCNDWPRSPWLDGTPYRLTGFIECLRYIGSNSVHCTCSVHHCGPRPSCA